MNDIPTQERFSAIDLIFMMENREWGVFFDLTQEWGAEASQSSLTLEEHREVFRRRLARQQLLRQSHYCEMDVELPDGTQERHWVHTVSAFTYYLDVRQLAFQVVLEGSHDEHEAYDTYEIKVYWMFQDGM